MSRCRGQVAQLLFVETARNRLAVERDVVDRFGGYGHCFVHASDLEGDVDQRGRRRTHERPGSLVFLEVRGDDLHTVSPRLDVGCLVAALRIGFEGAGNARSLVHDQNGGPGYRGTLRIHDRAADGAEEGLRGGVAGADQCE